MNRPFNEFKAGWNEVRWIRRFLLYLLPATAFSVFLAYVVDGKFSNKPSALQILLIILASLLSLYFALPNSTIASRTAEDRDRLLARPDRKTDTFTYDRSTIPLFGERLLLFLLSKDERVAVIGDLTEGFQKVRTKFGKRRAEIWFYSEVIRSIEPLLLRAVIKWLSLVGIIEIIHRLIAR